VLNGQHFNGGCCFDYGNAESNNLDTGAGSMEAICEYSDILLASLHTSVLTLGRRALTGEYCA
jgi:hypothetical protein